MNNSRTWTSVVFGDVGLLVALALARVILHTLTNGQYGFHRDELLLLDDARRLDWGFVEFPPLSALITRGALELFGPSLAGLRLPAAIAQGLAMLLAGLMARELGGGRLAQAAAALATAIAPVSLAVGALVQYTSFDYLWWVLIAYLTVRLLKSDQPRWWIAVGAAIGVGLMTKYTTAVFAAALAAGVLLTGARRYLRSPWLWAGAGVAVLLVLPNLIWQAQHGFISLDFVGYIHARDVRIGRTDDFLIEQLYLSANLVSIPLWVSGLYFYLFAPAGKRFRPLGWMFVITFAVLLLTRARGYYTGPAYPMLLAAGAVSMERWLAGLSRGLAAWLRGVFWGALALGGVAFAAVLLPVAPLPSGWFDTANAIHEQFGEQVGWPELADTVAQIYQSLPAEERAQTAILAANYGEAGAMNLYGPERGLPPVISRVNTYWLRGYGDPPPETLIVLGMDGGAQYYFGSCSLAGRATNRFGVENEETRDSPDIYVCRDPRKPWPELWKELRTFG